MMRLGPGRGGFGKWELGLLTVQIEGGTLFRYRFGDVEFDEARFELQVGGASVDIQPKPLALLAMLLRTPGEVVTSEEILQSVWKYQNTGDLETNVIGTALTKLRNALGKDARRIVNLPRVGYRFEGRVERVVVGHTLRSGLALESGMAVPMRPNFVLRELLSRTKYSEVWRARHAKTDEVRIYKFSPAGDHLLSLKREATLYRLLHDALGERPDIVRVIDWNFAEAPFFLECEDGGENLRMWADAGNRLRGLGLEARIALFLQIADAVSAAHGVGVLHKDLKPDNVLVAARGDGWQVRLSDFGSGQLLEPGRLKDLGITQLGFTMTQGFGGEATTGTLLYLAPELARGETPTIQSDVYALGLLLYQLVVGDMRRPLVPGWQREVADELLQQDIAAATDGNPSHRLNSVGELANALRRIPERRAELASRRALEQAAQQAQEALKRARARLPWMIAALASMAIGLMVSSWLYVQSRQAYLTAEAQRTRAEAINKFLNDDLLGAADTSGPGGQHDPTVRELLARAAGRLEGRFGNDPATKASVDLAIGQAYFGLSDYASAETFQKRGVAGLADSKAGADGDALTGAYALARTLGMEGHFAEAGETLARADAAAGERLHTPSRLSLLAAWSRGNYLAIRMQPEQALPHFEEAERIRAQALAEDDVWLARTRGALAWCYVRLGRNDEAIAALKGLRAPKYSLENIGITDWQKVQVQYAMALSNLSRFDEAEVALRDSLRQVQQVLGQDNYITGLVWNYLGTVYQNAAKWDAAIDAQTRAYAIMRQSVGEQSPATLGVASELAISQYLSGRTGEALPMLESVHAALAAKLGEEAALTQDAAFYLASALTDRGRQDEAFNLLVKLRAVPLNSVDPAIDWAQRIAGLKGTILIRQGKLAEGRPLLEGAVAHLTQEKAPAWVLDPLRATLGAGGGATAITSR
ncbi:tetratricopeptide repeat protein [Nevskia soli]|uniref:tetratricopeptide repeat protein n=1 Tax=Nevskia soli TaxID=418856 RepID=UPI000A0574E0|nr:tetratricopeptide repeat protein [Nevskia soli]